MFAYLAIITFIGNVVSVALVGWAAYEAGGAVRLIMIALLVLTFLLPALWSSSIISLVCFVGRMGLGLVGFIYLKWQRVL